MSISITHSTAGGKIDAFVWGGTGDAGKPMKQPTAVDWFDRIVCLMMAPSTSTPMTVVRGDGTERPTKRARMKK